MTWADGALLAAPVGAVIGYWIGRLTTHRPVMTDQQWRCFMDSQNPYADKTKPHSCPRCGMLKNLGADQ